ncbi:permease prefix domain 1-containing protein [Pseudalkalibacillus sp. A8]|uniref:permease prefix domain 1-containing protein n=1 Tax=Pseudalkalibacillus sp. A8 TaxID=3382641 RepID=UPI0038B694FB
MTRINEYVDGIVERLPITAIEKEDLKQELIEHLEEHITELMGEGWGKDDAVAQAIQSFGDKDQLHKEMHKAFFPYHKIVRWLWSTLILTGCLSVIGYCIMEFLFPRVW